LAAQRKGMGRGLAAILPESSAGGPELRELPVEQIEPNPEQPRSRFDAGALEALAGSISSAGLLQPLIVRPLDDEGRYELVAGERRWRAAQKAGLERVPAVVRTSPQDERLQAALIENMVREDLNPVDEARACASLVEDLGISKEELARRVGRSRASISNLIRLLDLPDPALELLSRGALSEGHGRALLQLGDQEKRKRLAKQAASEGWSVRETERRAAADGAARRRKPGGRISAEERAALREAEEALESALGRDVRVRRAGTGVKAELHFDDLAELELLARRLKRRS
jgi:ParB family chromosome partitioning protein